MSGQKPGVIHLVENDLLPFLAVEWEGQDITGFTILLHVRKPSGLKFSRAAVVDDFNVGGGGTALFHFEWVAGDLCVGLSEAEIETFDPSALNETFKGLILDVAEEIA